MAFIAIHSQENEAAPFTNLSTSDDEPDRTLSMDCLMAL